MLQINEDRFNLFLYVMIFPFTCPHILYISILIPLAF